MSAPAASVNPTLNTAYAAIVAFIISVTGLPATSVVRGLSNRTSAPLPGFIVVQFLHQHRLRTNIHAFNKPLVPPDTQNIEEAVELTFQIDCYGPNSSSWATILSTLLRDEYGMNQLFPSGVVPLYADEARMMPVVFGEQQFEERWSLDARFQMNPVTTVPQQYAEVLKSDMVNVNQRFPG